MKAYSNWRKSRRSAPDSNCVEVARAADGTIGVRDSKEREVGGILEFSREEWRAFLERLR